MKIGDKKKKEIIQRYLSGESKISIAKSFNVSHTTISKILNSEKVSKSFNFENVTMLAFLESKRPEVQELMSKLLSACNDKITRASLKDCTNAFKDLATMYNTDQGKDDGEEKTVIIKFSDGSEI